VRRDEPTFVVVGRYGTGRGVGAPLAGRIVLAAADPLKVTAGSLTGCGPWLVPLDIASAVGAPFVLDVADFHFLLDGAPVEATPVAISGTGGTGPYSALFRLARVDVGHHTLRFEVDTAAASGEAEVSFDCLRQVRRRLGP